MYIIHRSWNILVFFFLISFFKSIFEAHSKEEMGTSKWTHVVTDEMNEVFFFFLRRRWTKLIFKHRAQLRLWLGDRLAVRGWTLRFEIDDGKAPHSLKFFFFFLVQLFIQNLISIRMMILYNQNDDTLGVPCTQTIPLITCHRLLPATKINQCDDYCGLHHDLDRKKLIQRISSIHGLKSLSSFFFFALFFKLVLFQTFQRTIDIYFLKKNLRRVTRIWWFFFCDKENLMIIFSYTATKLYI